MSSIFVRIVATSSHISVCYIFTSRMHIVKSHVYINVLTGRVQSARSQLDTIFPFGIGINWLHGVVVIQYSLNLSFEIQAISCGM